MNDVTVPFNIRTDLNNDGNSIVDVEKSEEVQDLLTQCFNLKSFCSSLLPENFYAPFSSLHDQILGKMDVQKNKQKLVIAATRGIGKTTISRARAAKAILYAESKFLVYLSTSATHAEQQTENLKKDLLFSPMIKSLFGSVKFKGVTEVDESWSKKTWMASVGAPCDCGQTPVGRCPYCGTVGDMHFTLVLPRGDGQQLRGLVWKSPTGENLRPDFVIIDDLEDDDTIENEDIRKKRKRWFFGAVRQVFPRYVKNWKMVYIDTVKHEDALIVDLLNSDEWDSLQLSVCDENLKSLAPDFMSDEEIKEEYDEYREQGLLDVFAREIMSVPISREDATFKPDYFRYYGEGSEEFEKERKNLISVVIVDPAKTVKQHSAETGMVVWGISLTSNKLYLRYAAGEKLHPDDIEDRAIELCDQFDAKVIGIEQTGSGEFVTYPLMNRIISMGKSIEVVPLNAKRGQGEFAGKDGGKKMRVASLVSYYRRGVIYHNEVGIGGYETQLLSFPRPKRWDIMDAAGYITEMLDKGGRFFFLKDMDNESWESVEKEYEELEEDDYEESRIGDGWRIAP